MSLDNQFRSGGLETYTTLDADNRVAYVSVTANGIAGTNLLNLLDSLNLIVELFTIDGNNLTLVESDFQQALILLGSDMLQISLFRQTLCGVEELTTTDAGAPDAYIVQNVF